MLLHDILLVWKTASVWNSHRAPSQEPMADHFWCSGMDTPKVYLRISIKLGCPSRFSVMNQPNHYVILAKTFDLQPEAGKGYTANPLYNFRCRWFRWLPLYPRSWEMVSPAATKQIPIPKRSQGPWSRHLRIFWSWDGKGVWILFKNIRWIRLCPQFSG